MAHFKRGKLSQRSWPAWVALVLCSAGVQAQTLEQAVRHAMQQYPAVRSAQAALNSANAEVERAFGAYYPTLSMESSASKIEGEGNTRRPVASPRLSWSVPLNGRVAADVTRAESAVKAAQAKVELTQDEVALQIVEAWLGVVRSHQMVTLAQKNLVEHESILEDVRRIVSIDAGRALDLEQARVRKDAAANALNQRRAELSQSQEKLARYYPEKTPHTAFIAYPASQAKVPSSQAQALGVISSPAIAQAQAQAEEALARAEVAKRLHYPSFDVSVARQRLSLTGDVKTVATAGVNMPLYEGGRTEAAFRSSLALAEAAKDNLAETELLVKERIRQGYVDLSAANDRLMLSRQQRATGAQLVQGFRAQFTMARRTLLDLLNIQNEYAGYQQAEAQAEYDVQMAQYRIRAALGQLAKSFTR